MKWKIRSSRSFTPPKWATLRPSPNSAIAIGRLSVLQIYALSIAARQGHASLVSTLLETGADPDVADSEGWTLLRASAWGGHASTVQVLLERGAHVDSSDWEGRTALRSATKKLFALC